MSRFVDTSVWTLSLRRDRPSASREVALLAMTLEEGDSVFTTGLVPQELLQGFQGPKSGDQIRARFAALPFVVPDREDHGAAAELRDACRRQGVQVGTIDVFLAQSCIGHGLSMLTTDASWGSRPDTADDPPPPPQ